MTNLNPQTIKDENHSYTESQRITTARFHSPNYTTLTDAIETVIRGCP